MIKVVLFGAAGRMGRLAVEEILALRDIELVAGVESPDYQNVGSIQNSIEIIADSNKLPEADVYLDFSFADPAMNHFRAAKENTTPIVMAATGFSEDNYTEIKTIASEIPVLLAPNLSIGIGVMDRLIGTAVKLLGEDFDAGLSEIHHSSKRDAPSGTAKKLAEHITSAGKSPQIVSLRAGGAVGEHSMRFVGSDEELIITHRAWSRKAFARGVSRAIRFIFGKAPGLYSIRDIYGEG